MDIPKLYKKIVSDNIEYKEMLGTLINKINKLEKR